MGIAKRITKNTIYLFLSQVIIKIIHLVFIGYSARVLGVKYYGIFVLVNTMVLITSTLTNFGIRAMIIRKISKDRSNAQKLLNNVLAIRLLLSVLLYMALSVFVNLYGYPEEVRLLVYIAGIVVILNIFTNSFEIIYIAFEKIKVLSALSVLSSFTYAASAITVLALGYHLKTVFSVNVIVCLLFALLSGYYLRRNFFTVRPGFNYAIAKEIGMQSLPFFFAMVLNILNTKIDIMMLSMIDGPVDSNLAIGYFAPAHNILLALMILPKSLNTAMLPVISRKIYSDHEFVKRSVEKATKLTMIMISFPIILVTTFFSEQIITMVFGPAYIKTVPVLTILGWAYAFFALNIPTHSVLGSSKELKAFLPLLAGIFLLNVLLNYMLIPKYSYIGASISTCAILIIGFIGRFYFMRKILQVTMSEITGYLKLLLVMAITMGVIYSASSIMPWPLLVVFMVMVYASMLYFFKAFEKDEVRFIADLVRKKLRI